MKFVNTIKIGTFFRTRVRIHYTWLLVILLIPWAVSTQYSTETALLTRILLGLATSLLFFLSVALREIALLTLAVYKGMVVRSVTVFAFGGLFRPDYETTSPSHGILLAVSGMLLNLVITGIFYFAHLFFKNMDIEIIVIPLKWLAFFWFTLSLFHLVPAYPLGGGNILHGIIWKATNNVKRATRIAGYIGWILGFLTMVGGILLAVLTAERFTGMFFIGLGLIIQNAATHGIRYIRDIPDPPTDETRPPDETGEDIPVIPQEVPVQNPSEQVLRAPEQPQG